MFVPTLKLLSNKKCFVEPFIINRLLSIRETIYKLSYIQDDSLNNVLNKGIQIRYKSYKRVLDYSKVPQLNENDLEEQFVRGDGPGGQATNKTANAVVLKHKPTGLVVKCHETRSLLKNREIARENMIKRLDNEFNGQDSLESQKERLMKRDSLKRKQKQKKLADLKESFEKRENLK